MVFPIVGGNESKGYDVENSLRINAGDSAYLSRTQTAGNQRTFTASVWVKRSRLNDRQALFSATVDGSNECFIWFDTDDELFVKENTSNSTDFEIRTNRKFRDPSAWYHIVVAYDTTESTAGDRVRIYVNGVEETSFANETQPNQNFETKFNKNSQVANIGRMNYGQEYFGGYLTEIHWVDGSQLAPTSFGEFDDNGVWIPKKYTGSYGTNGYFLEFQQTGTSQNSSGIGADTSGQDNHWAVTNLAAIDITEDTCTNNFATFSPLGRVSGTVTLSEGNCKIEGSSDANASGQHGTIAFTSGKWYLEMKATDSTTTQLGFLTVNSSARGDNTPDGNGGMNYHYANIYYQYNNSSVNKVDTGGGGISAASVSGGSNSSLGGFSDGDILMFALDMDNNRAYFGKNGTWFNSGNPANGTNYFSLQTDVADGVTFYAGVDSNTGTELNTGNPPFSISSGNNDGKYGNFEYEVPSGYYAMCTKRLAEFG